MGHAVALIPGFLGFDHDRTFTYFADRLAAGLRAQLEAKCEQTIPVVAVPTLPVGSLAKRQQALIAELARLAETYQQHYPGAPRPTWHLVGHSTGGLDAALLSCSRALEDTKQGSRFTDADLRCEPIASVTTVSAPLYGTALALAPGSELVEGKWTLRGLQQVGAMLLDTIFPLDSVRERFNFANAAVHGGDLRSLLESLRHNELATDLRPDVGGQLLLGKPPLKDGIARYSIATIAPRVEKPLSDRFFSHLWTWTSQRASEFPPPSPPAIDPHRLVANRRAPVPDKILPIDSDGVVNTERQFMGKVLAVVCGDHGDVIGRYRRYDFDDKKLVDPGLLTSGAVFGDDEFFRFLGFLSEGIAETISSKHSAA